MAYTDIRAVEENWFAMHQCFMIAHHNPSVIAECEARHMIFQDRSPTLALPLKRGQITIVQITSPFGNDDTTIIETVVYWKHLTVRVNKAKIFLSFCNQDK